MLCFIACHLLPFISHSHPMANDSRITKGTAYAPFETIQNRMPPIRRTRVFSNFSLNSTFISCIFAYCAYDATASHITFRKQQPSYLFCLSLARGSKKPKPKGIWKQSSKDFVLYWNVCRKMIEALKPATIRISILINLCY
ncbi:Uncharacterised protein [uncultured archaeon]|nr:Uncharacterised protein [uncultured archaeon]